MQTAVAAAVGDGACALVSMFAEMQFLERFAGSAIRAVV